MDRYKVWFIVAFMVLVYVFVLAKTCTYIGTAKAAHSRYTVKDERQYPRYRVECNDYGNCTVYDINDHYSPKGTYDTKDGEVVVIDPSDSDDGSHWTVEKD